jgi:hypothetical protein
MNEADTLEEIAKRAERIHQAAEALGLVELDDLAWQILHLIRDHHAAQAAKWIA